MGEASAYDLDDLIVDYFGAVDALSEAQGAGLERLKADFGREAEPGKRIALWLVLAMVGAAPAVGASFPDKADRITARTLAELLAVAGRVKADGARFGPQTITDHHRAAARLRREYQSNERKIPHA